MTALTLTYDSHPMPIVLSDYGARLARCAACGRPTQQTAWGHARLRGLYCSPRCITTAKLDKTLTTAVLS